MATLGVQFRDVFDAMPFLEFLAEFAEIQTHLPLNGFGMA